MQLLKIVCFGLALFTATLTLSETSASAIEAQLAMLGIQAGHCMR